MSVADRIEELRKRYEENPRRFFAPLANEYRKSGDLEQAISLCQEHLADQPGNMNGHVVFAQALFEAGRFDESALTFETALSLDPENLIALRHLGDMARDRGDIAKAREWYTRVLDADPRNDEILGFLQQMEAVPAAAAEALAPASVEPPGEATTIEFGTPRAPSTPTPVVPYPPVEELSPPPGAAMGLMDLSIDLGLNTNAIPDRETEPPADVPGPAPEGEMPSFADDGFASIGFPEEPAVDETPLDELPVLQSPSTVSIGDLEIEGVAGAEESAELPAAAPGPSGTDFLFADTIKDFPTIGGEAGATGEEVGATLDADAVIGRTPDIGTESVEPTGSTPKPFVTETMAELYLEQGFRDEALQVYRQLSAQSPNDDSLRQRIASIEGGGRSSLTFDVVHEEILDVAEGSVPLGAMLEMTPHEVTEEAHLHPHSAAPVRSARAFFAALAVRRAVKGDGMPQGAGAAVGAPSSGEGVAPGALDTLFGPAIGDGDEAIARTLASVAEGVERAVPSVKGKPTQMAETELSLDTVFRDSSPRPSGAVPRQSQTLRFDQFFSSSGDTGGSASGGSGGSSGGSAGSVSGGDTSGGDSSGGREGATPGAAGISGADRPVAPSAGEPGSPADLEHFQSWLSGLKLP